MKTQAMGTLRTAKNEDICLHIGCGLEVVDGWENIDASPSLRLAKIPLIGRKIVAVMGGPNWSKKAKCGDLLKGLNVSQNSCAIAYASHVFEHLSYQDFFLALDNVYGYLKPGGIFRIIVPDLEKYIEAYIEKRSNGELATQAAFEFMHHSWTGHQGSRRNLYSRLREAFSNHRHQWMWDEPSLKTAFAKQGFTNIRRCNYGDWLDPRFAAVETETKHINSVCIQGIKAKKTENERVTEI